MVLADSEIRKRLASGGLDIAFGEGFGLDQQLGPASLDFRLGNEFTRYDRGGIGSLDPREADDIQQAVHHITIPTGSAFTLHPRQFILGVTLEKITLPADLVATCQGRSSLGRLGIIIHSTAGFIDPGFAGRITLEITNINEVPIKIYPTMRFGQFVFDEIVGTVDCPYNTRVGSKYMHQHNPTHSKIYEDTEFHPHDGSKKQNDR